MPYIEAAVLTEMRIETVKNTVCEELCCGCGICKGLCPKECISMELRHGMYLPLIDEVQCISCGLCAKVCPGLGHIYVTRETASDTVIGDSIACYNAWSIDPILRHVSASGGVVSAIVRTLLKIGRYDSVFTLDKYDYHEQLKVHRYTYKEFCVDPKYSSTPRSRYLPVSHEETISYIKAHRNERSIIIGTSCAIRGIQTAVEALGIDKKQYLFIGLFCDKVFNYNVLHYFEDKYNSGAELTALHFKNKESGGWPGDMKFFPKNGKPFYVPLTERTKAKAYFMPERCLYCVDKLNVCADISIGDNYTKHDSSELGSNSVIIRTDVGKSAWDMAISELEKYAVSIDDIQNAQAIDIRLENMYYGDLRHARATRDLNRGIPREKNADVYKGAFVSKLQRLSVGSKYDEEPNALIKQIEKDGKKANLIVRTVRRVASTVRRRIGKLFTK